MRPPTGAAAGAVGIELGRQLLHLLAHRAAQPSPGTPCCSAPAPASAPVDYDRIEQVCRPE
eukprot:7189007-Lingulodinium_polyedra.AAC.1